MNILLKTFWVFLLLFTLIGCSDSNNNLEFKGNIYEDSTSILFFNPDCITIYNVSGIVLTNVQLKVTVIGVKGDKSTRKYLFRKWENNESKKVYFELNDTVYRIQKAEVEIRSDQGSFDGFLYKN